MNMKGSLQLSKTEQAHAGGKPWPLVSVVMPVRNEATSIAHTLRAVAAQDYPCGQLELIVADGMSTDGTRNIVSSFQSENPRLHMISNPARTVSAGLNAAIVHAQGEIIIRLDGHTEVATDYVRQCVTSLLRTGVDNVGGRMTPVGRNFVGRVIALATSTPLGVGNARFHYSSDEEQVDTVYLGCWRKTIFEQLGLFDEEQVRSQDAEFNYRLLDHGGKILLTPHIKSRYTVRSSLWKLVTQYFQYGFWKVRVIQKHPRQVRWRQLVPPALVITLAALLVVGVWTDWGKAAFLMLAGAYMTVILTGAVWVARKAGWRYLALLPAVFSMLHSSWGLGFLVGLFRFWNRWRDRSGNVPAFDVTTHASNR